MSTGPLNFDYEFKKFGDSALLARLRLPDKVEGQFQLDATARYERLLAARKFTNWLQKLEPESEFVAGYDSVLVPFRAELPAFDAMVDWLQHQLNYLQLSGDGAVHQEPERLHRIPVVYGGVYGPDLEEVSRLHNITPEEVIEIHTRATYTGYLTGFSPGFTYLGPLPPEIDAPRRPSPRPRVPPGSVALAAGLTGIYPDALPGGWSLVGFTSFSLFEPLSEPPIRILPGDKVQFFSVTSKELDEFDAVRRDLTASLKKEEV